MSPLKVIKFIFCLLLSFVIMTQNRRELKTLGPYFSFCCNSCFIRQITEPVVKICCFLVTLLIFMKCFYVPFMKLRFPRPAPLIWTWTWHWAASASWVTISSLSLPSLSPSLIIAGEMHEIVTCHCRITSKRAVWPWHWVIIVLYVEENSICFMTGMMALIKS